MNVKYIFLLLKTVFCFNKPGTWIPIGSRSTLPNKLALKILDKNFVVWKNPKNDEWSLMEDVCPHRLAPLSQGRIDPDSGCIECPYHGFQFSQTGQCTKIPQAKGGEKGKNVDTIPLMETGDLIWGKFNLNGAEYNTKPNEIFPELDNVKTVFTRDLPYSFDFLVENFMDPAHIPFAHHGLQGVRSDGIHIPMKLLTSIDDPNKVEISFYDRIMGKMRSGIVSFTSPCYYHFRVEDETGNYKIQLMVLITPVSPGMTRVHLAFIGGRSFDVLPKWISHSFSNRFLETDIWLHDCELQASKSNKDAIDSYYLPTSSDIGPKIWRKWWSKHMSSIPAYESNLDRPLRALTPIQQRERVHSHINKCTDCQKMLRRSKQLKKISICFLLFIKQKPIISIASFVLTNMISDKITNSIYGGFD